MPMQMGFRWYGEGNDNIKLSDIKQIPGVTSIVWALHHSADICCGPFYSSGMIPGTLRMIFYLSDDFIHP